MEGYVMSFDPNIHHRRSIRLRGYDYSQAGAYFVTLCTQGKKCLFGEVVDAQVHLSDMGQIVAEEWLRSADIRPEIDLDEWIVMPNHLHGIIVIPGEAVVGNRQEDTSQGTRTAGPKPRSLGSIMAGFESASSRRINELRGTPGMQIWQHNYYDHIIRNEKDLERIRRYIADNPARWDEDAENPLQNRSVGATRGRPGS